MATTPKKTDAAEATGTTSDTRQPMAVPAGGWPADEFTGKAGSFERDPYTGKRRCVDEPTEPAKPRDKRKESDRAA